VAAKKKPAAKKKRGKAPPRIESAPRGPGQPEVYDKKYPEQAKKLAQLGATDREVAEFFGVSERTLHTWKHTKPEFLQSLKIGKDTADNRVEQSLYRRAVGYSHDAVRIFMPANAKAPVYAAFVEHVAPDTTACIFWLKNRRKAEWRDQLDHKLSGKVELPGAVKLLSDVEIEDRLRELRGKTTTD
jgi:hypothetical protein